MMMMVMPGCSNFYYFFLWVCQCVTLLMAWGAKNSKNVASCVRDFLLVLRRSFKNTLFLITSLTLNNNDENKKYRYYMYIYVCIYLLTPVEPKPPAPRSVASKSSTSTHSGVVILSKIICAIRSPFFTSKSSSPKLAKMTPTFPR